MLFEDASARFPLKPQVLYSPPLPSLFRSWNMKDQGQRGAITVTYEAKAVCLLGTKPVSPPQMMKQRMEMISLYPNMHA